VQVLRDVGSNRSTKWNEISIGHFDDPQKSGPLTKPGRKSQSQFEDEEGLIKLRSHVIRQWPTRGACPH